MSATEPSLAESTPAESAAAPGSIQVIARLVGLLDVLAGQHEPLSLKSLAQRAGLHPSTAHRILQDLVRARLVERAEPGMYRLGMRLLELGNRVKARLDVRQVALEPMRALYRQTQQPVNLSIRQGDEIVYVERAVAERGGMQVVRAVGGRAPLHLTSVGKLFLAADSAPLLHAYARRTGLRGQTRNSLTELAALEQDLEQVRARGSARDNEELEPGVRCLAAGVYDDAGQLVAGLSISAPAAFLRDEWVHDLVQAAQKISAALGYEPAAELVGNGGLTNGSRRAAPRAADPRSSAADAGHPQNAAGVNRRRATP